MEPAEYEKYHQERLKHKKRVRWDNPHRRKARAKKEAGVADGAVAPGPKKPVVQMPDEYLPPNKILFIQNMPAGVTKDQLNGLFAQFVCSSLLLLATLIFFAFQIPKFTGNPSHSHQEGYRFRRVYRRTERNGCKGCVAQL